MTIYTVYQTTNNVNGKIYVGAHETDDPNDSYLGSGRLILRAIKKHGKENFTKIILSILPTREAMYLAESLIVDQEVVDDPMTYNMCLGGLGGSNNVGKKIMTDGITEKYVHQDDIKGYINKGWKLGLSPETIEKMSGENNNMYNKKHSPEAIKKMSKASKGKPKSPEHIKNMSGKTGEKSHMYGKTGADSTTGGKMAINNGSITKKVFPDVAKEYYALNEGWTIGRGTIPINDGKNGLIVFPDVAKEYYALNVGWMPGMKPRKKRNK